MSKVFLAETRSFVYSKRARSAGGTANVCVGGVLSLCLGMQAFFICGVFVSVHILPRNTESRNVSWADGTCI